MIPKKVTAVWAYNEDGMPADHGRRLQKLLPSVGRMEDTNVCFDLRCIHGGL